MYHEDGLATYNISYADQHSNANQFGDLIIRFTTVPPYNQKQLGRTWRTVNINFENELLQSLLWIIITLLLTSISTSTSAQTIYLDDVESFVYWLNSIWYLFNHFIVALPFFAASLSFALNCSILLLYVDRSFQTKIIMILNFLSFFRMSQVYETWKALLSTCFCFTKLICIRRFLFIISVLKPLSSLLCFIHRSLYVSLRWFLLLLYCRRNLI